MSSNLTEKVQQTQQHFEELMAFVTTEAAQQTTAYQVEQALFKQLLGLGSQLLGVFFAMRAEQSAASAPTDEAGSVLPLHSYKAPRYVSIFGEVTIKRPYFYRRGQALLPLDGALSLPEHGYSDLVRETVEVLSISRSYAESASLMARFFGLSLSTRSLAQMVEEDADEVRHYYEEKAPPAPEEEAAILVAQADGKGVPMVYASASAKAVRLGKGQKRKKKKEALVTGLYTTVPRVRTPEAVVASFLAGEPSQRCPPEQPPRPEQQQAARPQHKQLWATLEGKERAFTRLRAQVERRDGPHVRARVALCDGCEALQRHFQESLPCFRLVLDFVPVTQYLWKAANVLFGEQDPQRLRWVQEQALALLSGQRPVLVETLRQQSEALPGQQASAAKVLGQVAGYYERNAAYMHYDQYLARGWPIASGVIEGACRHLVKDRCEGSGMRWTPSGAEPVLALRSVYENGDWDGYHARRRRQRQARLYQLPFPGDRLPEEQALSMAA